MTSVPSITKPRLSFICSLPIVIVWVDGVEELNISVVHLLPPATKLGQGYVFTRVCDSVHRLGGYPSMHRGRPPSKADPLARRPPWQGDPPPWQGRRPWQGRPPGKAEPPPPLRSACWEIRSTNGRYASYCNAIPVSEKVSVRLKDPHWKKFRTHCKGQLAYQLELTLIGFS